MLEINLSKQASKFLQATDSKHAKQIARKLVELQQNPFPNDSKQLKATKDIYYRTDVGEYRIIYNISDNTILIPIIGKRNDGDVYKKFFRKV
jgi:mRNA interferase RelE/StbE